MYQTSLIFSSSHVCFIVDKYLCRVLKTYIQWLHLYNAIHCDNSLHDKSSPTARKVLKIELSISTSEFTTEKVQSNIQFNCRMRHCLLHWYIPLLSLLCVFG
ncbi:hypothetical protein VIGAN_06232600 [Vigna angularis var. angularis]|uniref:Uncharacterized protein n=1 Tax=Vigna angularis var. angularis TaxID=157739 RepID=A0A0S3SDW6_PHAAN|nr:hypothetical protein VIGAN_06232600 [Vigna angularis var. angularis]